MSTFDDDERSAQGSRPIYLYTIVTTSATYRLTSHIVDVVYGGNTFTAVTMGSGDESLAKDPSAEALIVYLPITHELVQRYAATGIPEQAVVVTVQKLQSTSGIAAQVWTGFGQSMSLDEHVAMLRVPTVASDALRIQLPVIAAQRLCNHRLFDIGCSPNPGVDGPAFGSFSLVTTVVSQVIISSTEVEVTVASDGGNPDGWATYGQLANVALTDWRFITNHVGNVLTINVPFVGLQPGDGINLSAGCAHDATTCRDKFSNRVNFGGAPQMNSTINPWVPNGLGITQQV